MRRLLSTLLVLSLGAALAQSTIRIGLAEDPDITEYLRLWWDADDEDKHAAALTVVDLAYASGWYDGVGVYEAERAVCLPNRFVAMVPTACERDDGWPDGIGWLDYEPELFASRAEAEAAIAARKASLLAPASDAEEEGR